MLEQVGLAKLQFPIKSWAIKLGHAQIAKNQIKSLFLKPCQGEVAVCDRFYLMTITA
jgi:hypothetical protein